MFCVVSGRISGADAVRRMHPFEAAQKMHLITVRLRHPQERRDVEMAQNAMPMVVRAWRNLGCLDIQLIH